MVSVSQAPLVAIVGPTASGKSALALTLAERYNGEIICADSQTIRRDMNIGTAKPSSVDRVRVPHHLLDIIEPYAAYNAAQFKRAAERTIDDIAARGKVPFLVGGTGLYIDAVLFDFAFLPPGEVTRRQELDSLTVERLQALHAEKGLTLPVNRQNKRHLVRSLEAGGTRTGDTTLRAQTRVLGMSLAVEELHWRIEQRIEAMFDQGWLQEVRAIIDRYGTPPDTWEAIGYKLIADWLAQPPLERCSEKELHQMLLSATRHYAKRQRSWFKRNPSIVWVSSEQEADQQVRAFLARG